MKERAHELNAAARRGPRAGTWYGMPAYARDGNVVCFFQSVQKFKTRYATLGLVQNRPSSPAPTPSGPDTYGGTPFSGHEPPGYPDHLRQPRPLDRGSVGRETTAASCLN
jgi:hypothetical protein